MIALVPNLEIGNLEALPSRDWKLEISKSSFQSWKLGNEPELPNAGIDKQSLSPSSLQN